MNASENQFRLTRGVHLDTTTHSEGPASRNAGFIRQSEMSHGPLPDKSGVPVAASRCTLSFLVEPGGDAEGFHVRAVVFLVARVIVLREASQTLRFPVG